MDYESANGRDGLGTAQDYAPSETGAAASQGRSAAAPGNAIPLVAGSDGTIVLPAGVTLDDVTVRGRDLVIEAADGRTYVIADGAVFVPTLVLDGVSVPPLNLAALLIGADIQPAAGTVQSSGNNFADPVGDIQDAFRLGDLLPYTDFGGPSLLREEVLPAAIDREVDVLIQDGGPASANAVDQVDEAGLAAARPTGAVESPGTLAGNGSSVTTGSLLISAPDGLAAISVNGVAVNLAGGTVITTGFGTLTLGAYSAASGTMAYTYTLNDNLTDNTLTDQFAVVVRDADGDTSTASLTITILDDSPIARPDANAVTEGATVTGAVLPNDTAGADGFALGGGVVGVRAAGSDTATAVSTTTRWRAIPPRPTRRSPTTRCSSPTASSP